MIFEHTSVVALPGSATRRTNLVGLVALGSETTILLTRRRHAAQLAMLMHRVADPVDTRIVTNG